jgi:type I restriction enzyme S subunit
MSKTSAVPQGYKMTELGVLPKDWDVTTFGNVFDFLSTANNSRADLSDDGEIKYIHYGDIHTQWSNFVDFSTASIPALSATKTPTATLLRDGDLIVADASEDYPRRPSESVPVVAGSKCPSEGSNWVK